MKYTLLKINETPKTIGKTHNMIKVNFQLATKDVIKLHMTANIAPWNKMQSVPIPFSIVWMLLEELNKIDLLRSF